MIDQNFKPWLIEVNASPSFSTDSPLDYEIKKSVVKDTLALLYINQERKEAFIKERTE
jgi:tubulin polyglutamylase TTLL6/13